MWQFAIVIFVCLTGCLPWQKAASDDPRYVRFLSWHTSTVPIIRQPKLFKLVSSKAQRLFRKYLEPKPEKRPNGLSEIHRYMDDRWMSRVGMDKNNETAAEEEGLCPSMYSFHSSPEEKNKLLFSLTQYGLETTVDRSAKKDRIREWIQSSVIEEEDETEDGEIQDADAGPIGERKPITERKLTKEDKLQKRKQRRSSIINSKTEVYSPPIDPRIPLQQQMDKKRVHFNPVRDESSGRGSSSSLISSSSGTELHSIMKQSNGSLFNAQNALPFQNMVLDEIRKRLIEGDGIKHKINVQLPQSHSYAIPLSPKSKLQREKMVVSLEVEK